LAHNEIKVGGFLCPVAQRVLTSLVQMFAALLLERLVVQPLHDVVPEPARVGLGVLPPHGAAMVRLQRASPTATVA
jgi:hypothetical protein